MKIALVGFMGAGKSTVGELLSKQLGLPWYDTDLMILSGTPGLSVARIFAEEGESGFRRRELAIGKEIENISEGVISTGGGFVTAEANAYSLKARGGVMVYLHAPLETLTARAMRSGERPLLRNLAEVESLYERREELYRSLADFEIDTARLDPATVASHIMELIKGQ